MDTKTYMGVFPQKYVMPIRSCPLAECTTISVPCRHAPLEQRHWWFFAGQYNKSWNDGTAPKNPLYQELYVRWLQFGTFTPMMRSHGADTPREIYQFGQKRRTGV